MAIAVTCFAFSGEARGTSSSEDNSESTALRFCGLAFDDGLLVDEGVEGLDPLILDRFDYMRATPNN